MIDSNKPVDDEIDRAATYVLAVLDSYQNIFKRLGLSPKGLTILELGPGADFGAQLILASMGAKMILADRFLTQLDPTIIPAYMLKSRDAGTDQKANWRQPLNRAMTAQIYD